ncbi:MAG: hypothetical protein EWM45_15645 [Rhodopseudomonas palustris]|nr:MAG: hypothetical protein EWM45_15645 [Rhodopseudomonas palustris]
MTAASGFLRSAAPRLRHGLTLVALITLSTELASCGSINDKLSAGMGDYVPQWAGGLPADAPPRPGTPQYDAWMRENERRRHMPAAEREKLEQAEKAARQNGAPK